jgi:ribonuclease BN (tRNA processing enzyme)
MNASLVWKDDHCTDLPSLSPSSSMNGLDEGRTKGEKNGAGTKAVALSDCIIKPLFWATHLVRLSENTTWYWKDLTSPYVLIATNLCLARKFIA